MKVHKARSSGYSLLELCIVMAIMIIVATVGVLFFSPALHNAHVNSAVQTTVSQLRMAREEAVDRRMLVTVTFLPPGTIQTQRTITGTLPGVLAQAPVIERSMTLPNDVQFLALPGLPTGAKTPDGFGNGNLAIDFDQANGGGGTVIFFNPDGTATDALGNPNDGVVYIALPGALPSSHAITMFGATGRFKVYSLTQPGGNPTWQ
jgi:type II secretory pathway pseudopilin PulG